MSQPDGARLEELYVGEALNGAPRRYETLAEALIARTSNSAPPLFFSSPGRTELGGNHTDHNHGKVLCASVRQDMIAAVQPRSDQRVQLSSSGFPELFDVELSQLEAVEAERGNTAALIRGVAANLVKQGFAVGGFDAVVESGVPVGSGLSSSASFEVLVGGILNALYNANRIDPVSLARIGQAAENHYFGKPCGLMDQIACAAGGVLSIDFRSVEQPEVRRVEVDVDQLEYRLTVVDTGGSHADLTDAYASIPAEMKAVAALLGGEVLRDLEEERVIQGVAEIRERLGDRALLRALHYFAENKRVDAMHEALERGAFSEFLAQVAASGASSLGLLQNIIPPGSAGSHQPVALALGISERFFARAGRGVSRVHGGGFAGTIQAWVHKDDFIAYRGALEAVFGPNSVHPLQIRPFGVTPVEVG